MPDYKIWHKALKEKVVLVIRRRLITKVKLFLWKSIKGYKKVEKELKDNIEQLCRGFENNNFGDVMVVGGGISGVQASLDLAASGFKVFLVEKAPSIGGHMAQLDKTFPTNECSN